MGRENHNDALHIEEWKHNYIEENLVNRDVRDAIVKKNMLSHTRAKKKTKRIPDKKFFDKPLNRYKCKICGIVDKNWVMPEKRTCVTCLNKILR